VKQEKASQVEWFIRETKNILRPYLSDPGLVLYSNRSTLRRNPVLFYGINPGYDPIEAKNHPITWAIGDSLDYFEDGFEFLRTEPCANLNPLPGSNRLHGDCNLIDDQCWPLPGFNRDNDVGRAPYQRRTRHLLKSIGFSGALVTNLLFLQSKSIRALDKKLTSNERTSFLERCWRVHELILEVCSPNVILTCSTVIDRCFENQFGLRELACQRFPARHALNGNGKDWDCRVWETEWRERPLTVIAIPHMSVYDITNPNRRCTLEEIKEIVGKRTQSRVG
jgi:hypothetical protein